MPVSTVKRVEREQAIAFRLESQHLAQRLPPEALLQAAGACGVQNTPPGSAALALHARVANLSPASLDQALALDKTLLQVWSLRAAPHFVPTGEAAVFTLGLLPEDEASRRAFIFGVEPALERIGISASQLIEMTAPALERTLDGRTLTKDQLGIEIAALLEKDLTVEQSAAWGSPSWYAAGQTLGESAVRFALPVVALQGSFCYAPRQGKSALFIRTDQWLGAPLAQMAGDPARAELARRYLHCFGPSTAEHFAGWAGISAAQAGQTWKLIESELVEVYFAGKRAWLLAEDAPRLQAPHSAAGARFLPPHDPYLCLHDRTTLIPDLRLQRRIWRTSGNPGIVLLDGVCAAMWRPQKKGRRLKIRIESFAAIPESVRDEIRAEAASLAPFRECDMAEVEFA